jgi:hypothetical protein
MAHDNGYTHELVKQLNDHFPKQRQVSTEELTGTKWITFTYFNPAVRRIANIVKDTELRVAFHPTNTIGQYRRERITSQNTLLKSGIYSYEIRCHTCNLKYI